jgi:chloramphenicol 3-O-phosphotransferase
VTTQLIFLYGPPGVGKLTVAKELASLTGYKVFHNHLTFDLAAALFEPFSRPFGVLCDELRMRTFAIAAEQGLEGLIFTFVYAYPHDDGFVDRVREVIEAAGGRVRFVQLVCQSEELMARVQAPDRRQFGKLSSPETLAEVLTQWDLDTPVTGSDTLRIDNTEMSPSEVARRIVEGLGLERGA